MRAKQIGIVILVLLVSSGSAFCQMTADRVNQRQNLTTGIIAYCYYDPTSDPPFQIFSIHLDGTNNTKIINSTIGLNHHEFSPDGKRIACVGYINMSTTWSIYILDADGTNLKRLTNVSGVFDGALSWSRDASTIAFTRSYPSQPSRGDEVWLMNADGSNQHFSGIKGFQPMWSPNGTQFVYSSNKSGNYEIYTSNVDGMNEQQLTINAADDSNPVWSPDGSQIAFSSDKDGNLEIYIMKSDGTQLRRLTNNSVLDNMPRWSPDGSTIVFNSDIAGNQHTEVYLMSANGSNIRRLTNSPGNAMSINPAWSPVTKPAGVEVHSSPVPSHIKLQQNYPNPFNPSTTIPFELLQASQVKLDLVDFLGREITTLVDEYKNAGIYSVQWDGTDMKGNRVTSGIYLVRLTHGKLSQVQKILVLK
jgi:Tol biopolymer transport system component